ncbi:hypothetical protein ZWY2020_003931 [Hordeum vulgare]|nr:hypothetical protein ZWY2020_003931 [Hordeum vulgare]
MATANLSNVVVVVDGSKESMKVLRWALDSLRLRPDGALIVLHVLATELPTGTIRYSCKILSIDEHFDGAKILHLAHGSTLRESAKSAGLNTQAPTGLPLINGTMVYQGATSSSERSRAPCRGDRSLGSAADRGPCHGRMELPEWVDIVKTTMFKELPPTDPDWYYMRAVSLYRQAPLS